MPEEVKSNSRKTVSEPVKKARGGAKSAAPRKKTPEEIAADETQAKKPAPRTAKTVKPRKQGNQNRVRQQLVRANKPGNDGKVMGTKARGLVPTTVQSGR